MNRDEEMEQKIIDLRNSLPTATCLEDVRRIENKGEVVRGIVRDKKIVYLYPAHAEDFLCIMTGEGIHWLYWITDPLERFKISEWRERDKQRCTERTSRRMACLICRAPYSPIPRQFLNDSLISE